MFSMLCRFIIVTFAVLLQHNTVLAVGSTALASFESDGFMVLRNVLHVGQVFSFREIIDARCKEILSRTNVSSPAVIKDCLLNLEINRHRSVETDRIVEHVDSHPKIQGALRDVLGPTFRRSTRNEIRVGTASPAHTDTLEWCKSGAYPAAGIGRYPMPPELNGLDRNGSEYAIATVAIYLQDHEYNERSLHVWPASHRYQPLPFNRQPTHLNETSLHPSVGDVVIFDTRLWHRGASNAREEHRSSSLCKAETDSGRDASAACQDSLHRQMMAFTYGRDNAFTLHHDVCHAIRNDVAANASRCREAPLLTARTLAAGGCVQSACGGGSTTLMARGCGQMKMKTMRQPIEEAAAAVAAPAVATPGVAAPAAAERAAEADASAVVALAAPEPVTAPAVAAAPATSAAGRRIRVRLEQLNELLAARLVTQVEYDQKRAEILRSV